MSSRVKRDHHNFRRTVSLNGNKISNDGGDEGISVADNGNVTVSGELDIDGSKITSAGALEIDPGGALTITGQNFSIDSAMKLGLDSSGDTYIAETSSDIIGFFANGLMLSLNRGSNLASFGSDIALMIDAGAKLHLDGSLLGGTYIHEVSDDKLEIVVGLDEMLTLDEANQRVTIEADKLSYAIAGGTEWGATDSAYAGHILGYTCIGADAADDSQALTTSFEPIVDSGATAISTRFKTPPSEFVEIEVELYFSAGSGASDLFLSLSDEAVYAANSLHHSSQFEKVVCTPARGNGGTVVQKFLLNSNHLSSIGSLNTIYLAVKTDSTSGTPIIKWGGDATGDYTNLVIKATALPVNITVGS